MALVLKSNKEYQGTPSSLPSNNIAKGASYIYASYLVNSDYKGALLTAANSSGDTKDFFAQPDGFLSASEIEGFAKGGNVYVVNIKNQSSNGVYADRSDAAYRPILAESGVAILNRFGKPSIKYSGGKGLIDRTVKTPFNADNVNIFYDVEPKNINELGSYVYQLKTTLISPTLGEKVYISLSTKLYADNRLEIQYNDDANAVKLLTFNTPVKPYLVLNLQLDSKNNTIKTIVNGDTKEEAVATGVTRVINFTELSIASQGSGYNSAQSFDGIINCIVIR